MKLRIVVMILAATAVVPGIHCKSKKDKDKNKCETEKYSHKSIGKESVFYMGSKRPYYYNADYDDYHYTPYGQHQTKFSELDKNHRDFNPSEKLRICLNA